VVCKRRRPARGAVIWSAQCMQGSMVEGEHHRRVCVGVCEVYDDATCPHCTTVQNCFDRPICVRSDSDAECPLSARQPPRATLQPLIYTYPTTAASSPPNIEPLQPDLGAPPPHVRVCAAHLPCRPSAAAAAAPVAAAAARARSTGRNAAMRAAARAAGSTQLASCST
jgi:hypothetical protein